MNEKYGVDYGLQDTNIRIKLSMCEYCKMIDLKPKLNFPLEGGGDIKIHETCIGLLLKQVINMIQSGGY